MKTNKVILTIILTFYSFSINCQQADDITVIKSIANNIRSNTSFAIVNTKTNEIYSSSDKLPVAAEYRIQSPYNMWHYWNGVLTIGMIKLGNLLKDTSYSNYAIRNIEFIFKNLPYFEKQYKADVCKGDMLQHFRLDRLDDCGAMGAGTAEVNFIKPNPVYLAYLNRASDYIMTKENRLSDGTFARKLPHVLTVWGDDLYMSIPLLARMGKLTGDVKYFDEAARQVVLFDKHLFCTIHELNFHCWYDDLQTNGVAHWGRGYTWELMAEVELLSLMPTNHPMRDNVISILKKQIIGIAKYQSESGLWHQLIDKPDSYLETSCSAMITYAVAKAVNQGWIADRYKTIAQRGWEGIKTKVLNDGQVENICMGTGISDNLVDYYKRPAPLNDIHGLGAVLLAGCEILQLPKK